MLGRGAGGEEVDEKFLNQRNALEGELEKLMKAEELYWQQGGEKWVLEGDSNFGFFHLVANGRMREKKLSCHSNMKAIQPLTVVRSRGPSIPTTRIFFGKIPNRQVSLGEYDWATQGRLSPKDNIELTKPFCEEEVRKAIFDMEENTASGPDGFGVSFYRSCGNSIKDVLMEMINDFYMGALYISRLNYGVITLVPKVADANNVKQFCPICLMNVSFKIFTKLLMDRLAWFAQLIISPCKLHSSKGVL